MMSAGRSRWWLRTRSTGLGDLDGEEWHGLSVPISGNSALARRSLMSFAVRSFDASIIGVHATRSASYWSTGAGCSADSKMLFEVAKSSEPRRFICGASSSIVAQAAVGRSLTLRTSMD